MSEKLKPLSEHPDYHNAAERLAHFHRELAAAQAEAARIDVERLAAPGQRPADDPLARADALLSGAEPTPGLSLRASKNSELITALRKAIAAQAIVLRDIARAHAAEVRKQMTAEHIKLAQAVLNAADALVQANEAEAHFRRELASMGYDDALPAMSYAPPPERMVDLTGGYGLAWRTEVSDYIRQGRTAAELDGAKRDADAAVQAAAKAAQAARPKKAPAANPSKGELVS